jgi:hypothetical protein
LDKLEYWKLCTDFTVVQAALIICGFAPEQYQWRVERTTETSCPDGYIAVRTALKNALMSGRIKASSTRHLCDDEGTDVPGTFDIELTTISAEEIDRFLKASGAVCDFFDRSPTMPHDYQVGGPTAMPPKLYAALSAWRAITDDPRRLRGKSPKQALEEWLLENAAELGLVLGDGRPNRTGIEEICKVANWKPGGGATPTPINPAPLPAPRALVRLPVAVEVETFTTDLDDEIPF